MSTEYKSVAVVGIEMTFAELQEKFKIHSSEKYFEYDIFKEEFESKNQSFCIEEVNDAGYDDDRTYLIGIKENLFLENPKLFASLVKKLRKFLDKKGIETYISLVKNIYAY